MTTGDFRRIREMNQSGMTDREVAQVLGVSTGTAFTWRKYLGLPPIRRHKINLKRYTVIDVWTEEVLCTGTAEECARVLGMTVKSFWTMKSRWKRTGRGKYEFREEITTMEQLEGAAADRRANQ